MESVTTQDALNRLEHVLFDAGERGDEMPRANTTVLDEHRHFRPQWRQLAQRAAADTINTWQPGANSKRAIARVLVETSPAFRDAINAQWTHDQQASGLLTATPSSTPLHSEIAPMLPAKRISLQNKLSTMNPSELTEMLTVLDESWESAMKEPNKHGKRAEIAELDMKIKMVQGALGISSGRAV